VAALSEPICIAFMALQATRNAAVSSVAVANITGKQADVNRTLKAQGIETASALS
jgi:MFS superfamily sulfate permease-like transporter